MLPHPLHPGGRSFCRIIRRAGPGQRQVESPFGGPDPSEANKTDERLLHLHAAALLFGACGQVRRPTGNIGHSSNIEIGQSPQTILCVGNIERASWRRPR